MKLIILVLILNVAGWCQGYKLRRDMIRIKQYCKDFCIMCGGESYMTSDVCTCEIKTETDETDQCLENMSNKFKYLGIELNLVPSSNTGNGEYTLAPPLNQGEDKETVSEITYSVDHEANNMESPIFDVILEGEDEQNRINTNIIPNGESPEMNGRSKRSVDQRRTVINLNGLNPNIFDYFEYPVKQANFKLLIPDANSNEDKYYVNEQRSVFDSDYDDEYMSSEVDNSSEYNEIDGDEIYEDDFDMKRRSIQEEIIGLRPRLTEFEPMWESTFYDPKVICTHEYM